MAAVRRGMPIRQAGREFGFARETVKKWVDRARGKRLDRVNWSGRPPRPRTTTRTPLEMEDLVLAVRNELRETSDLGEFGARAIRLALLEGGVQHAPAVRTINRILRRRGALDGRRRIRRPAPPLGWYLPDVAAGRAELDSLDFVEGLVIQDGPSVEVLTGISLHGGLPAAWPMTRTSSKAVGEALIDHWSHVGCPGYAQFDNDTRFQGPHQHPDTLGRVTRLCLSLGVVPVFAPPRECGFQACIESFNGRWQAKVWARFHHESLAALLDRSSRYIQAARRRSAARIDAAPARRDVPSPWRFDPQRRPTGRLIYLRRTDDDGAVHLLGHAFHVDDAWLHRLVRADLDLDRGTLSFFGLSRRHPAHQPLLKKVTHRIPLRRFRE